MRGLSSLSTSRTRCSSRLANTSAPGLANASSRRASRAVMSRGKHMFDTQITSEAAIAATESRSTSPRISRTWRLSMSACSFLPPLRFPSPAPPPPCFAALVLPESTARPSSAGSSAASRSIASSPVSCRCSESSIPIAHFSFILIERAACTWGSGSGAEKSKEGKEELGEPDEAALFCACSLLAAPSHIRLARIGPFPMPLPRSRNVIPRSNFASSGRSSADRASIASTPDARISP
mmetsp:Transcript_3269/g.7677  ORF Transcript_3269/g.7677 Transcript_3269/m.7677 type:complete len:237 (-) Transcript_3269:200-910(-)